MFFAHSGSGLKQQYNNLKQNATIKIHKSMSSLKTQWSKNTNQLLEGRLVDVALQGEIAEDLPGRLVALDLHRVGLNAAIMPLRTGGHHWGASHSLDILQEHVSLSALRMHTFAWG